MVRISYRAHGGALEYWQHRWDAVAIDSGTISLARYPGLYAERAINAARPDGPVLEAGCGAGRGADRGRREPWEALRTHHCA